MEIITFKGGFDSNFTYLAIDNKEALIIDPSVPSKFIFDYVKEHSLRIVGVVVMHGHMDHKTDLKKYKKESIKIYGHKSTKVDVDIKVDEDNKIKVGNISFKVMHTPGHRFDCICLYSKGFIFTSDTLFVGACGRVDLPGSNPEDMLKSLFRLKSLPDNTVVYPGHDYGNKTKSTIKEEKENNRYFNISKEDFMNKKWGVKKLLKRLFFH